MFNESQNQCQCGCVETTNQAAARQQDVGSCGCAADCTCGEDCNCQPGARCASGCDCG